MKRRLYRMVSVLVVGAVAMIGASRAWAHARPKVMVPAADSTVESPKKISMTFSEGLVAQFSSLKLLDGKGTAVGHEKSKANPSDAKVLTLDVPGPLPAGPYTVHWVAAAVDGHRMEGEYKFTVR